MMMSFKHVLYQFIEMLILLFYNYWAVFHCVVTCFVDCWLSTYTLHVANTNAFFHLFSYEELSGWLQVNKKNDWVVTCSGNAIDLYSGGAWFYSQSEHRPFWLIMLWFSLVSPRKCQDKLKLGHDFPSRSFEFIS